MFEGQMLSIRGHKNTPYIRLYTGLLSSDSHINYSYRDLVNQWVDLGR